MNYFIFYCVQLMINPQNTHLSFMQGGRLCCLLVGDVVKSPEDLRSLGWWLEREAESQRLFPKWVTLKPAFCLSKSQSWKVGRLLQGAGAGLGLGMGYLLSVLSSSVRTTGFPLDELFQFTVASDDYIFPASFLYSSKNLLLEISAILAVCS